MQGSFNTHLIGLTCVTFVVVAAFLIFDLDAKFYPAPKQHAATIDYTETAKTLLAEPEPAVSSNTSQVTMISKKPEFLTRIQNEPKSRLNELENKEFSMVLNGDAYLGISGVLKKASLTLKLAPIKGTNLQEFKVMDSRLFLDSSGVLISGIGAKISGKDIALEFVSDNVGKFIIHATLDQSILDDTNNKQNVVMEDQDFYLIKKETPYRLNLVGTLSS